MTHKSVLRAVQGQWIPGRRTPLESRSIWMTASDQPRPASGHIATEAYASASASKSRATSTALLAWTVPPAFVAGVERGQ